MKLTNQEIKNSPSIKPLLELLIPFLSMTIEKRLESDQEYRKRQKKWLEEYISDADQVWSVLANNKNLSEYLGINPTEIPKKIKPFKDYIRYEFKKKRASTKKRMFEILKPIFLNLTDMGLGQTRQVNFINTLYKENNYENYATANNEIIKKALWERIRKDQERALKDLK